MKHTIITLLIGSLLALVAPLHAAEDNPAMPNIVIFLVDDMGVMDTSVPFLTDETDRPKRYPLNDFYRTLIRFEERLSIWLDACRLVADPEHGEALRVHVGEVFLDPIMEGLTGPKAPAGKDRKTESGNR